MRTARPVMAFELTRCDTVDAWPEATADWIPAIVPGGVHESLEAAGTIPSAYYGTNEESVRWVEEVTWCYRATVSAPDDLEAGERLWLDLTCLDGVATVRIDGVDVARHANQHRPLRIGLAPGRDVELLVRFTPPLEGALPADKLAAAVAAQRARQATIRPGAAALPDEALALPLQRTRRRKAAFSWGWDFAPRLPSIGLAGPVELVRDDGAVIDGVHVRTTSAEAGTRRAAVSARVTVDDPDGRADAVRVQVRGPGGIVAEATLPAAPTVDTDLRLEGVDLWWTRDLGSQPLYDFTVELRAGERILDARTDRIGLRTLELDRGVDAEGGRRFRLELNGVPLFCRGANWVPASMLVGSIPDARYRRLVELAGAGGMNMLRIWGGGIYEAEAFYEACDELGVLVWQDFMFACNDYPDDRSFREEVRAEAAHQVRRLRNRPSLAVWCGNNEVQAIHQMVGRSLDEGEWGRPVFHEDLPRAVELHSPGAIYWPGSPWSEEPGEAANSTADGDRHTWEVWHGLDIGIGDLTPDMTRGQAVHFRRYANDRGRFISEFGIHACPELDTLRRWLPDTEMFLRSPGIDHHNKDTPKDKGWVLMEEETGAPADLEQYVDFSMACQAEGLKFGVEHYRRRQPTCSGTLVWQFNDPWPGLTWSVIDYDLVPKAGYYFLQRAYRPVVATFRADADRLELWVTNSSTADAELQLRVVLASLDGRTRPAAEIETVAKAHDSRPVWTAPVPLPDLVPWAADAQGAIEPNRLFLAPLKELNPAGRVEGLARRLGGRTVEVTLRSTGYSYLARVMAPLPGITFDRNYVDLLDGQTAVVRLEGVPDDLDLSTLRVASYGHRPEGCSV